MLGKITEFQRISSNVLRVMDENLWRSLPGLNRVERPFVTDADDIDFYVSLFILIHSNRG